MTKDQKKVIKLIILTLRVPRVTKGRASTVIVDAKVRKIHIAGMMVILVVTVEEVLKAAKTGRNGHVLVHEIREKMRRVIKPEMTDKLMLLMVKKMKISLVVKDNIIEEEKDMFATIRIKIVESLIVAKKEIEEKSEIVINEIMKKNGIVKKTVNMTKTVIVAKGTKKKQPPLRKLRKLYHLVNRIEVTLRKSVATRSAKKVVIDEIIDKSIHPKLTKEKIRVIEIRRVVSLQHETLVILVVMKIVKRAERTTIAKLAKRSLATQTSNKTNCVVIATKKMILKSNS